MIEKGMLIRCATRTKGDVFGDVLWEVVDTGLKAPEKGRENEYDGVKVIMLGGSGPSARAGMTVIDSEWNIKRDMATGITVIVPPQKRAEILAHYSGARGSGQSKTSGSMPRHGGTGVVEIG
jgi:hypothetical protein